MRVKRTTISSIGLLISAMLCLGLAWVVIEGIDWWNKGSETARTSATATAESIARLDEQHKDEVQGIIWNFESRWDSLETNLNPSLRAEITTEHYLRYPGVRNTPPPETSTLHVTTSANVINTHVLEYSADRIVAVADVIKTWGNTTVQGETVGGESTLHNCQIDLFSRPEEYWKLHELFLISHEEFDRYWEDNAAYLEPLFGPKPDKYLCQWWEGRPSW